MTAPPRLQRLPRTEGGPRIVVSGRWDLSGLQLRLHELAEEIADCTRGEPVWDLREVERLDNVGALLLWRGWGRRQPRLLINPDQADLFADFAAETPPPAPPPPRTTAADLVAALGRRTLSLSLRGLDVIALVGRIALDAVQLLRHPAAMPRREISANIFRTGAQALGITALVGFLVGVVLSYLSAQQLRTYGANVFIIKVLGVGIVRELGPLLAAILVAGRSGSAMTAQLGVMRVTQELDALAVMGISISQRLVLPKVAALTVTLPLLVLWTDAIALVGGMLAANWQLGISFRQFLEGLPPAVGIANLWLGVGKGAVFGALIALVACHYGLRIKPNSESLGSGTTASVVTAITVVIVVDAAFATVFSRVGL